MTMSDYINLFVSEQTVYEQCGSQQQHNGITERTSQHTTSQTAEHIT